MSEMRVPPRSLEAEGAILGGVLRDPEFMNSIGHLLKPEHFYQPEHGMIWAAIQSAYLTDKAIGLITVREEAKRLGHFRLAENQDLWMAVTMASDQAPTVHHALELVRLLVDKAALRSLIASCTSALAEAFEERASGEAVLARAQQGLFEIAQGVDSGPRDIKAILSAVLDDVIDHPGEHRGILLGFDKLDQILGGLKKGHLCVLAGTPGTGKTTLALNWIEQLVTVPSVPCAVFSLEMTADDLLKNLLFCRAGVDAKRLEIPAGLPRALGKEEFDRIRDAAKEIHPAPLYLDDAGSLTVMQLLSRARGLVARKGVKVVFVDYLQLLKSDSPKKQHTTTDEISEVSRGLKMVAKTLNVPVVAISQLNRPTDGVARRPVLTRLKGSSAIEQDADEVIFLWRPEEQETRTELIVAKQRNGPTGAFWMEFEKPTLRFYEAGLEPAGVVQAQDEAESQKELDYV